MTRTASRLASAATLCVLLALGAGTAVAQSDDIVAATVGRYTVLPVDGSLGCPIRLQREKTIGGRIATPGPECAARIKPLGDAAAWYLDGSVVIIDATRRKLMRFEEDETALPANPSVAEPRYYLVPAVAGITHLPQADELAGAWQLTKGKGTPCTATLDRGKGKASEGGALRIEPGCKLAGLPPKLKRWRTEAINLLLESDDDGVVFGQTGASSFAAQTGGFRLSR